MTATPRATGAVLSATTLAATTAATLYAAFCPTWLDVRAAEFHRQGVREGNVRTVRRGYVVASALVAPAAVAASVLVGSWLPALGAGAVAAAMIGGYEHGLRHPAAEPAAPNPPAYLRALQWGAA